MESYNSGIAKSDGQVAQLLSERPPGWEYLLYAGALCTGVERLETKYMDYSLRYAPRLGVTISQSDFLHFISSQLSELQIMINSLSTLVNAEVLADAVGPSGHSGDPDKILHAAARIVRLYGDMFLWAERIRGMAMPDEYREVTELLVRFAEQPINEIRDFVQRFGARIDALASAPATGERVEVIETIKFTIPDELVKEFNTKLEALKPRAT
jgi:hypothetical protein